MKTIILLCVVACTLAAQDSTSSSEANTSRGISAIGQFFDHDFVNFYAYGNGFWDSRVPQAGTTSTAGYGSDFGWEAGGGITAVRTFRDGGLSVNYRGGYRGYEGGAALGSGTQQSLSFGYNKRLNRQWTLNLNVSGGILGYGSSFYSAVAANSETPGNAGSLESRFGNGGISLTYQQTRRLSYVFSGSYLYSGYHQGNPAQQSALGNPTTTHGYTGSASVLYRLTARTTVGGTYSHAYYEYTGHEGSASIDGGSLTLSHQFQYHWQVDISAGANHSNASGRAPTQVPVVLFGQTFYGICECPYNRVINSPSYQGTLSHYYRHSSTSITGGQSILGGNGIILTSRDQFANGTYSYSTRRSNLSFGGNFARLSSVSTAAAGKPYSYWGASASYGLNLVRYLSSNLRYDLLHYDGIFGGKNLNENRVSFGLSFSSQSVPLTLF